MWWRWHRTNFHLFKRRTKPVRGVRLHYIQIQIHRLWFFLFLVIIIIIIIIFHTHSDARPFAIYRVYVRA